MRPTGSAGDGAVVFSQTLVGFVAVGLDQPFKALEQLGNSFMGTTELPVEDDIASWFADNAKKALRGFAFFLIGSLKRTGVSSACT